MISLLFPDVPEAAFSIYNLVFTTASSFTFAISFFLCLEIKMYIYFGSLAAMAVTYTILEMHLRKDKSSSYNVNEDGKSVKI